MACSQGLHIERRTMRNAHSTCVRDDDSNHFPDEPANRSQSPSSSLREHIYMLTRPPNTGGAAWPSLFGAQACRT